MRNTLELVNKNFDRLTVLEFWGIDKNRKSKWLCVCSCGNLVTVYKQSLTTGNTKSCSCLEKERTSLRSFRHGFSKSKRPLYSVWLHFHNRCYNTKNQYYHDYGGRGIRVSKEWLAEKYGGLSNYQGLKNFIKWCKENPKPKGKIYSYSLDRMNNNGPYSPENVRWATSKEQIRNTRLKIRNHQYDQILKENLELKEKIKKYESIINI